MLTRRSLLACVITLPAALTLGCSRRDKEPLRVAAAADLRKAFDEIGSQFQQGSGEAVTFTYGSTGLLARQIAEGAPFDVFAAANVSYVDDLIKQGAGRADSRALYARGQIVLFVREGAKEQPTKLEDLADARFTKIAIANPEHAPYGRAAQEALTHAGVWEKVKDRLVYGENIQQTLTFATTGNVDVAIVALSLSQGERGTSLPIDESFHAPLEQAMMITTRSKRVPAASAFVAFVESARGREIMQRHGFTAPGSPPPAASH